MKSKILSLLLSAIMVSSVLVSCKSEYVSKETSDSVQEVTDPAILEIDEYVGELAERFSYDGATFSYIGEGGQVADFEEDTGSIANDALYHRQRELEELFGIKWNSVTLPGYNENETTYVVANVKEAVLAGQNAYDLVYGNPIAIGSVLFSENCLEDVSEFSILNLDREWWNASLADKFSFSGRMFFLTGDIVTAYFDDPSCILFNKNVLEDFNVEEPYSYVKDGSWTFDKMFELASAVPLNTTGTGAYRYGNPHGLAILFAHGETITYFDDEGNPYVEEQLPARLSDIADRFSVIMSDNNQSVHLKGLNGMGNQESYDTKYGYKDVDEMFIDERILFFFATTGMASELREKEVEFGIVPVPKGYNSQDNYYSFGDNWNSIFVYVPRCTSDMEMTDVITEAMAALGRKYIRPAYYDKILKNRSVYDSASKEMIDIILENKIYDMADMYAVGNINTPGKFISAIKYAIDDDSSSFATNYFVYSKLVRKEITKIQKRLDSYK